MNEVEKMYENAGINKSCHANIKFDDCIYSPSDCGYYNYPDFTAEKQLDLLQLLSKGERLVKIDFCEFDRKYYIDISIMDKSYENGSNDFSEAIAMAINNLWQDLTEEEKQQVKGILE